MNHLQATKLVSRRRASVTWLLLPLVAVLAACGSSGTTAGTSSSTTASSGSTSSTTAASAAAGSTCPTDFKPIKADTLSVVTSLPGPGFFDGSEDDPTKLNGGYEYDIVQQLKTKLCLKNVEIRNVPFDGIVAGTITGYDVSFSQVTITPDRAKVVQFTDPYFEADQGVLMQKGRTVATADEARKLRWGAQSGTTGLDYVTDTLKATQQPQVFQQLTDAFTALQAGQVDAVVIDTPIALSQSADVKGAQVVVAQFKTGEQYGAILPKGSSNVAAVNRVIDGLKADGTLAQLAGRNLGQDPAKIPVITVT
jgi:polar amino acid transport system substrate-binding protein